MKLKSFLKLVGLLFAAKAVFGVLYLLLGWEVTVMGLGLVIPSWLMLVATILDGFLAYTACKLAK